jgi:UDP-glucose 4-epimerase
MRYLVTGGAGFIGSYLVEELLKRGDEVEVIDDLSTGRIENIDSFFNNPKCAFHEQDCNFSILQHCISQCDGIFHLAAMLGVENVVKNPLNTLLDNIKSTELIMQFAHPYKKKVLLTSSSEVYGKNNKSPIYEYDDKVIGNSPLEFRWSYALSKLSEEIIVQSYFKKFKTPTVIARLFSIVGPKQRGDYGMVVPRFVEAALSDRPLTVYGRGDQTRCFLHVKDAVKALIDLMDSDGTSGEIFNLGSEKEISIEDLAKKTIRITNSLSEIKHDLYSERDCGMNRRVPNIDKIKNFIPFYPQYGIDDIIQDVKNYFIQQKN